MQTEQIKTIEGKNLYDEKRTYNFLLMDAETGVRLFHQYASVIATSYPMLSTFFESKGEEETISTLDLIKIIPEIMTWEKIKELSEEMVANAQVVTADETFVVDKNGICKLAQGDPLEQYAILFYAICANYPKYLDPLLIASDEDDDQE